MPKTPWADRYRAAPTNKSNVMRTIILEGPISRAALAKRVGLSLPSVMTITENLINRGLVRAVGKGKSSGGKPPEGYGDCQISPNDYVKKLDRIEKNAGISTNFL